MISFRNEYKMLRALIDFNTPTACIFCGIKNSFNRFLHI